MRLFFRTLAFGLLVLIAHAAFVCDNGATTLADDSYINDDYCDCADGSDEPRTGACTNAPFRCSNAPHVPSEVFASRVNDGYCDCCDGSDESNAPVSCPNTCVDLASADLVRRSRASLRRVERAERGRTAGESRREKLAAARAALETSAAELDAARSSQTAAEASEAERKADRERRLAAGEISSALKLAEMSAEQLGVALARLVIAERVSGADSLHDKLAGSPSIGEAMEDVDSADVIEVAMEAKDAETTYDAHGPGSSGAQGAPQGCVDTPNACGFEIDLLKLLPLDAMPLDELRRTVLDFAESRGKVGFLAKISAALLRSTGATLDESAVASALALLEPFRDDAADAARSQHAALDKAASQHRTTIEELAPVEALDADFGTQSEWFALHAQCFTARDRTFNYNLCPFDTFTQDGRSLGKYEGWVTAMPQATFADSAGAESSMFHGAAMAFGGGEACDGKSRRAHVFFECGDEDVLTQVVEPSTCMYEARFTSPSACTTHAVREQHAALAAAAAAAGLPYEPDAAVKSLLEL